MIDKTDELPVKRQCEILELSRSAVYYTPVPVSAKDMELMRQIDEIHLMYPFYGNRKIRNELWAKGYDVGRDRVRRLMRRMGVEALYVKPKLSLAHPGHVKYPYLLRGLEISRANHVWVADITYIPMARGFCYRGGRGCLDRKQGFISGKLLMVHDHAAACFCDSVPK